MSKTINDRINETIRRARGVTVGAPPIKGANKKMSNWIRQAAGRDIKETEATADEKGKDR